MPEEVTWDGPVPVYRQVAGFLRDRIASGEIAVGSAIPSKRRLMQDYQVGEHTAAKAVALLKDEGLVETTHGLGVFVTRKP